MTVDTLPEGIADLNEIKILRRARRASWSRDGQALTVAADTGSGGEVIVWTDVAGQSKHIFECYGLPTSGDYSSKYEEVVYGTQTGGLSIAKRRMLGNVEQKHLSIHSDTVSQVEWSPNSEMIATASHDQTICIISRASEFRSVRRIQTTRDRHNALRWSPTGREIAVCGAYYGAQLFHAETGNQIWKTDRSANLNFHDVAWSPRLNGEIAVAVSDGRIWIVSPSTGGRIHELEGHQDAVISLSFSFDGRLLFSLGLDNFVRVWDATTFAALGKLSSKVDDRKYYPAVACHPVESVVAVPGKESSYLRLLTFDSDSLVDIPTPSPGRFRTRVKVTLVGQSEVGKTQVAQRLLGREYSPGDTTHGVSITSVPANSLHPEIQGEKWIDREILLWDLGGQKDYQLIHQLFLHDTTLALIMCDPTRREVAYHDVETWVNKLQQQSRGGRVAKILVGTKVDQDLGLILESEITNLCERLSIAKFVSTSAKQGIGIDELAREILEEIDWSNLERVVRPDLFQLTRDKLEELRVAGEVVITVPALVDLLRKEYSEKVCNSQGEVDLGAVNVVVTQLSLQGMIAETRLSDSTRALVLQIAEIERYAGSLLIMASDNADGIPAVDELGLLRATEFPGISQNQRLPRDQERVVLEAVVQLLLQNGLCLRHEGMLVFPSKVTSINDGEPPEGFDELFQHIDFHGAVENIYATLITSLSNGRTFGRLRLQPGRVEFVGRGDSVCAVACINAGPGRAKLRAFASSDTPPEDRTLFYSYIEEHFSRMGVELHEQLQIKCECGGVLSNQVLRARIDRGARSVNCPVCDACHDLSDILIHGLNIDSKLAASRIRAAADDRAKESSQMAGRVLAAGEERAKDSLINILHLSDLHISGATEPQELLGPLMLDLETQGIERIDYIVISGDVTARASAVEFESACEFISLLLERLSVTAARLIIVPGNHDVDWETVVYEWKAKRSVRAAELIPGYFIEEGLGYLICQDCRYKDRFKNFSEKFFHLLKLTEYPLDPQKQYFVDTFSEDGIQFLSFNSSVRVDEFNTGRSALNSVAVSEAIQKGREQAIPGQKILRIAVFHHPAMGSERMAEDAYLSLFHQAGITLCLHGHVHEERVEVFNYLHPTRIHVVGAGTFGAPAKDRPESTPRQYNLIQFDKRKEVVRVNTRAAIRTGGAWSEWCVWPNASGEGKQGWYELSVKVDSRKSLPEMHDEAAKRLLAGRAGS